MEPPIAYCPHRATRPFAFFPGHALAHIGHCAIHVRNFFCDLAVFISGGCTYVMKDANNLHYAIVKTPQFQNKEDISPVAYFISLKKETPL